MENKIYLRRYRLCLDAIGVPTILRRSAGEGTFKAEDTVTNENVALQIIPPAKIRASEREQLETDARLAQQIKHLNIPTLRDFGFEDEQLVYVTDYFVGTPADDWIKNRGPMPVAPVLRIGRQIVSALAAAAFHGIFHPALNPSNIMLVPGRTAEGEWPLIKVLNFIGVPPKFSRTENANGVAEARNFASPEQLETGTVDFRSEVYSLGCLLWSLLSGTPPAAGAETVAEAKGIPAAVRRLLGALLAAEPDERPLDPVALQEQFQDCLSKTEGREDGPVKLGLTSAKVAASPSFETEFPETPRRRIAPLVLTTVLLAAATGAGLFWLGYFHRARTVDKLGVPIGIPQVSPTPPVAIAENTPIAEAPSPSPVMEAEATPAPEETEPPALVSMATAAPEETPAENNTAEETPQVAAVEEAASTPPTAEVSPPESSPETTPETADVASNDTPVATPEPTAEVLPNETSPSTDTSEVAAATPEASEPENPVVAAVTPSPTPTATPEEKRAAIVKTKEANSGPTLADPFGKPLVSATEDETRANMRSQRSSKVPSPNESPRRRRQPAEGNPENLPVLPALPPDQ